MKTLTTYLKGLGILLGIASMFFLMLVIIPLKPFRLEKSDSPIILITNITIVDVKKDTLLPSRDVLIQDQVIQAIDTEPLTYAGKILHIDGTGKYLIPALWDMHVHLMHYSPVLGYPQFLANGVMHVRDMRGALNKRDLFASDISYLKEWNVSVEKGDMLGPIVHSYSTPALDGPHSMYRSLPDFFNCETPEDAVQLVRHFKNLGYNQVKIYNNLSRESFFAIADEANRLGLDIVGHKPFRISAIEASNAGMKSLEHGKFLLWETTSRHHEIIHHPNPGSLDNTAFRRHLIDDHDTLMLQEIVKTFVANDTYYCPTLLTRQADALADDSAFRSRYKDINFIFRFLAFEDLGQVVSEDSTELGRRTYRDFYAKSRELTYQAYKGGVKILAGTDVPEMPGISLHQELQILALAGLPAFEILRTATLYPAEYYQLAQYYGSVEVGKMADLVILDKNPVLDISNTQSIHSLVVKGRYIDHGQRKALINKSAKRSKSVWMTAKLIWAMLLFMTI